MITIKRNIYYLNTVNCTHVPKRVPPIFLHYVIHQHRQDCAWHAYPAERIKSEVTYHILSLPEYTTKHTHVPCNTTTHYFSLFGTFTHSETLNPSTNKIFFFLPFKKIYRLLSAFLIHYLWLDCVHVCVIKGLRKWCKTTAHKSALPRNFVYLSIFLRLFIRPGIIIVMLNVLELTFSTNKEKMFFSSFFHFCSVIVII